VGSKKKREGYSAETFIDWERGGNGENGSLLCKSERAMGCVSIQIIKKNRGSRMTPKRHDSRSITASTWGDQLGLSTGGGGDLTGNLTKRFLENRLRGIKSNASSAVGKTCQIQDVNLSRNILKGIAQKKYHKGKV